MSARAPLGPRMARATLAAALLVLLAGPLLNFGLVNWQAALGLFAGAAVPAGIGGLFCLARLIRRRGGVVTVIAAAAGIAAATIPMAIVLMAADKPVINDISTDTANPPEFVALTADRRGADANPPEYNPAFAPEQSRAYPQIRPLDLPLPRDKAFRLALAACKGWEIIASDADAGRIEAVARVPWWGFRDDIVIRLTEVPGGTRVDIRSKSRVGTSDLGVNARRISAWLDRLAASVRKAGA
ncbi:hypothetical protein CHU93_11440 [Sandarakinorhabdus cyanobacteriorum]|uniref:DUF1499 domain-containing protein n=1 Tax=Sandarakinorhabdus cyanobacteriorum TaxID=1981098 RepID=A0A255YEK1_9SPHN|nr:DUF1499 domain-containing protein [Sandarakinorhabdus cyanobacteriorum]OYQ27114.1 hypothetical protein CHU93_11440 [Sandarakinorhabdus cyanobacteriorum]